MEVAIEAIDTGGESALRLDSIVANAGVAITAVYHHFGNREGLMEAAQAERYIRTVWPLVRVLGERLQLVRDEADLKQTLLSILDSSLDPVLTTNRLRRLNVVGSSLGRPRLAEAVRTEQSRANTYLADLLRPFQERGMIRADLELEAFASWVFGVILSRAVVELEPDQHIAHGWDQVTRKAILALMFGELA